MMTTNRKKRRASGFTLIEMMVVLLLLGIILGAVFTQVDIAQKRSSLEQQRLDMFQEAREFMDNMTRDLRQAGYPNRRNLYPGTAATASNNAKGIVYVSPADVWFEGAVDGDGVVQFVKYHLDTSGTDCPCLRRSEVSKVAIASGATDTNYSVEVQGVQNGTLTDPIFTFYDTNGNAIDLSGYTSNVIDGTSSTATSTDLATLASIQTVRITVSTQAKFADLQTNQKPIITLDSFVTLPNCSQTGSGGTMYCN